MLEAGDSSSPGVGSRRRVRSESPQPPSTRSSSWQTFAGRQGGREGYQIGDFARGLVWQTIGKNRLAEMRLRPVSIQDLEPITASGGPPSSLARQSRLSTLRRSSTATSGAVFLRVHQESVLGEGRYGVVWRAQHRQTKEWYAVKNIKTPSKDGNFMLAQREVDVAEKLLLSSHPCVVKIFEVHVFADNDLISLVMEFCPGGDLLQKIQGRREDVAQHSQSYEPPPKAHMWIGQIFIGLEHLHKMDVLLRDLKPENVVFGQDDCAKLTDLGFGRLGTESDGRWSFGIPTGTPGFIAPEILCQEQYDASVDLYSFGVLVWVLLSGGLVSASKPAPPTGPRKFVTDFEALNDDFQLLANCLADPEAHDARPLPEDAQDFVTRLTQRDAADRLKSEEVRGHRFVTPLNLPAINTTHEVVCAWCREEEVSADDAET